MILTKDTKIFDVTDPASRDAGEGLALGGEILRRGGLVAFPTETVYGLGANALDRDAVVSIYAAKGRPSDNPLICHIADLEDLKQLTGEIPERARKLAEKFWPGPLTMVLPKLPNVPNETTGGLSTVAVRMPDEPAALELIRRAGCPVAAPSANLSGCPSPTKGSHVVGDLMGRVDVILTGKDCRVGIESTVLDLTGDVPAVLRPGILTPEEIEEVLGEKVIYDPAILPPPAGMVPDGSGPAPRAPGMKYTHYAPKAEMLIFQGPEAAVEAEICRRKSENEAAGRKVGVLFFGEESFAEAAHDFFAKLREMDDEEVDLILAAALDSGNSVGFAVMNRMLKSAGYNVITVD